MKIAILGDIHGNSYALTAVLEAISLAKVDKLLITGDLVGYYFSPLEVLNLLAGWDFDIVSGNHEKMLSTARNCHDYLVQVNNRYGSGLQIALEELSLHQQDWLCELPNTLNLELDGVRILLSHGAPWDVDEYIYPDSCVEKFSTHDFKKFDLVIMGHTHYPMCIQLGKTLLINPGSVGQPRNRMPGAAWALYDTESHSLKLKSQDYDSSMLVEECQRRHPELPYLANVLRRI